MYFLNLEKVVISVCIHHKFGGQIRNKTNIRKSSEYILFSDTRTHPQNHQTHKVQAY